MGIADYQLLDFGEGRKLERFGELVLDRPEVLATDKRRWPGEMWRDKADAVYVGSAGNPGRWEWKSRPRESWEMHFRPGFALGGVILKPGKFKHVGIFPEQEPQWVKLSAEVSPGMRVLNLFAYTGVASLVAAAAGGDVFHVDSARSVVNAAAQNAKHNGITTIHWVVEDALNFAEKEVKRGRKYDLILMDPPVFGKGKKGENHRLGDHLNKLVGAAANLLSRNGILLLNTYSPRTDLEEMVNTCENHGLKHKDSGPLTVYDPHGRGLTLSRYVEAVQSPPRSVSQSRKGLRTL